MQKDKLPPDLHKIIEFDQATLEVLGADDAETHGRESRITYGKGTWTYMGVEYTGHLYTLPLENLQRAEIPRFSLRGIEIPPFSEVKRTFLGGLKLQRTKNRIEGATSHKSTLSPKEYKTLKEYL